MKWNNRNAIQQELKNDAHLSFRVRDPKLKWRRQILQVGFSRKWYPKKKKMLLMLKTVRNNLPMFLDA